MCMTRQITRDECHRYAQRLVQLIDEHIARYDVPAKKYKENFGVGKSGLSMIRTGRRLPSLAVILQMSLTLHDSIDAMLDWNHLK